MNSASPPPMADTLDRVQQHVVACGACPRLVAWRERVAQEKTRRYLVRRHFFR